MARTFTYEKWYFYAVVYITLSSTMLFVTMVYEEDKLGLRRKMAELRRRTDEEKKKIKTQ